MGDLLQEMNKDNFNPDRGSQVFQACEIENRIGGFYGPFIDAQDFYSPADAISDESFMNKLRELNILITTAFGDAFDKFVSLIPLRRLMSGLDECLLVSSNGAAIAPVFGLQLVAALIMYIV